MKKLAIVIFFCTVLPGILYFAILNREPDPFSIRAGNFLPMTKTFGTDDWTLKDYPACTIIFETTAEAKTKPWLKFRGNFWVSSAGFDICLATNCIYPNYLEANDLAEIEKNALIYLLQEKGFGITDMNQNGVLIKNINSGETAIGTIYCSSSGKSVSFEYNDPETIIPPQLKNRIYDLTELEYFDKALRVLFFD